MQIATVSSKRQITIPKDMLEYLGLTFYGKVLLEKKDKVVTLTPMTKSVVEETAGSLRKFIKPSLLGMSVEEMNKRTKEVIAKHLAAKYKLSK